MTAMLVKIMVEVLSMLALLTKEMQERRIKKFVRRLGGRTDIEDALQRLDKLTQEETRTTAANTLEVTHSIKEAAENLNRNRSRERLKNWLSAPNPSINHNNACGAHHDGTGTWFIQGILFKEWKTSGSLLWVHGKPGSGKSILASAIIEDIKIMYKAGLASFSYFYFDFKDSSKRDIRGLLSSILSQLRDQSDHSWSILSQLYTDHRDGDDQPSEVVLIKCLQDVLNDQGQPATYIIVDAMDECPDGSGIPSPREKVLNLVEELVNSHLDLRICVTSRPDQDIRMVVEPLASHHISLHKESGQKDDISDYVRFVVRSDRTMRRWRPEDKELVVDTLIERANGMFRWVFCQLETLRRCFPQSIRRLLGELPTTLNETYERVLMEIPEEKWKHAHRLLQCLTVSFRPLRVEELTEVLAIRFDSETTPNLIMGWRPENMEDAILTVCSSLISVVKVEASLVVQFAHFSVKEYLTSDRLVMAQASVSRYHTPTEPAHIILAQACLSTLLELDEHIDKERLENYPLAFYAARHWFDHARIGNVSSRVQEGMDQLFDPDQPHFSAWIWLHDINQGPWTRSMENIAEHPSEPYATPLYYSAACGFRGLTERIVAIQPNDVNPREGSIWAPLRVAVEKGHLDVTRVLLEHGADVNVRGYDNWTPLQYASYRDGRDGDIMQLLLEHGADMECSNYRGQTPLHLASKAGRSKAVQLLLEYGADANKRMRYGWTPLHMAVLNGNVEAVRLLLQHGANVNDKDEWCRTALHCASISDVALALLECGADVDAQDWNGERPVERASRKGHHEVAQLLLKHSAR